MKTKTKTKKSIRATLIWSFLMLTVMIAVSLVCFNQIFTRAYFLRNKSKDMQKAFEYISQECFADGEVLQEAAEEYRDVDGLLITIFDRDGACLFSSIPRGHMENNDRADKWGGGKPQHEPGFYDLTNYVFVESEFSENPQAYTLNVDKRGHELICIKGKTVVEGNELYLMITHPMRAIDNDYYIFSKIGIFMVVGSILIGIVMSVVISKNISNPVVEIDEISKKIARLDFSERANENNTSKEVSDLAVSINEMSDKMKGYIADLTKANEALRKDIDDQKRLEKMRKEFIANVSHEMKTPLSLLQIYVENLKNDVNGIDKEYYCDTIVDEVDSLNQMVKSMLDISSIESGTLAMNFESTDFSALCGNILEKYEKAYEGFDFQGDIEGDVRVCGDAKYLEQAVTNFVNNAMRHTDEGKTIKLSLKRKGKMCGLSVFNQGEHIGEEDLEQLWDAFYRGDKARTRDDLRNVGLGLYIVKTIVEKHGGSCKAENREGGVEFSFDIPTEENLYSPEDEITE